MNTNESAVTGERTPARENVANCHCSHCKCNRAFIFDGISSSGHELHRCVACGHVYSNIAVTGGSKVRRDEREQAVWRDNVARVSGFCGPRTDGQDTGGSVMNTESTTETAGAKPAIRALEHSPGPWRHRWSLVNPGRAEPKWVMVISPGQSNQNLARISSPMGDKSIQEANARLIAAAPDLLEVVKRYHEFMPSPESTAAIKKAKGEAP